MLFFISPTSLPKLLESMFRTLYVGLADHSYHHGWHYQMHMTPCGVRNSTRCGDSMATPGAPSFVMKSSPAHAGSYSLHNYLDHDTCGPRLSHVTIGTAYERKFMTKMVNTTLYISLQWMRQESRLTRFCVKLYMSYDAKRSSFTRNL